MISIMYSSRISLRYTLYIFLLHSVKQNVLHFNVLMCRLTLIYLFFFTSQTLMNATWSIMVAAYTSATIYQAIIAALVMTDSIWHMTDITA